MRSKVVRTGEWEITGSEFPYHLVATSFAVAAMAVLMMGQGRYGLRGLGRNAGEDVPIITKENEGEEWCRARFGMGLERLKERVCRDRVVELSKALESVRLGLPGEGLSVQPVNSLEEDAHRLAARVRGAVMAAVKRTSRRVVH